MNTQYRKNLKDVATACKNYTDQKIDDLKWELGSHTLDVESDTTTAYVKTVPTGTIGCTLDKIGGMSYKSENLAKTNSYNDIMNNTIAKSIDLGNLPKGTYTISFNVIANTRTFIIYYALNNVINTSEVINTSLNGTGLKTYTFTLDNSIPYDDIRLGVNTGTSDYNVELENLMLNKGSTALPYQPYFEGIRDSAVTSVVSKDSNNTSLDTYTIPAEVQALDGYGWVVNDTCYNYIDLETKNFVKKVDRYTFNGNETLTAFQRQNDGTFAYVIYISNRATTTNVLFTPLNKTTASSMSSMPNNSYRGATDSTGVVFYSTDYQTSESMLSFLTGKTVYFEITPVETDISEYIEDNIIEVEGGGTLIFNNTYEQAVPSVIDYLIEEVKA